MSWVAFLLLAFSGALTSPSSADDAPTRALAVGEQRFLRIPGLRRYALGGSCIRVGGRGERLLIRGVREGSCDLRTQAGAGSSWEGHRFQVFAPLPPAAPDRELLAALSRLEAIEALPYGSRWVLRGQIGDFPEAWRIRKLERTWPERIQNETDLAPAVREEGKARLSAWIRRSELPLRLGDQDGQLYLRGDAASEAQRNDWLLRAERVFPGVRSQIRALSEGAIPLHLQVYLVALRRREDRSLGLQWEETGSGLLRLTAQGLENPLDLAAKIQALESEGVAQLLSRPEMVVRIPGEAELFAGGELPIEQRNRYYSQVQWKGYGISLKIKALEATGSEVRLEIQAEQSRLDEKVHLKDMPGIQSNRLKTVVDARFGTPILLSGLIQEDQQWQNAGLPGLRRIPLIGALFGTDSRGTDHAELVAALLPQLGIPELPASTLKRLFPRGPLPWNARLSPRPEDFGARHSPEYPWNALEP